MSAIKKPPKGGFFMAQFYTSELASFADALLLHLPLLVFSTLSVSLPTPKYNIALCIQYSSILKIGSANRFFCNWAFHSG
jgi:hypothetical protein